MTTLHIILMSLTIMAAIVAYTFYLRTARIGLWVRDQTTMERTLEEEETVSECMLYFFGTAGEYVGSQGFPVRTDAIPSQVVQSVRGHHREGKFIGPAPVEFVLLLHQKNRQLIISERVAAATQPPHHEHGKDRAFIVDLLDGLKEIDKVLVTLKAPDPIREPINTIITSIVTFLEGRKEGRSYGANGNGTPGS